MSDLSLFFYRIVRTPERLVALSDTKRLISLLQTESSHTNQLAFRSNFNSVITLYVQI